MSWTKTHKEDVLISTKKPVEVIEIPKEDLIGLGQMGALFEKISNTICLWVCKGWLPRPYNYNDFFQEKLGGKHPRFWGAGDVWKAFYRIRGAA